MGLKIYTYKNCSTCKRALKWLDAQGVDYTDIPIREKPPTKTELKTMIGYFHGMKKRLFNVSGSDYRALNLKEKISKMSEKEVIDLLNGNGNLVKRPFVLAEKTGTVGFSEDRWRELGLDA